ncbi:hypothetical protein ACFOGG_17040 [Brenneria rubrifaciens]
MPFVKREPKEFYGGLSAEQRMVSHISGADDGRFARRLISRLPL